MLKKIKNTFPNELLRGPLIAPGDVTSDIQEVIRHKRFKIASSSNSLLFAAAIQTPG